VSKYGERTPLQYEMTDLAGALHKKELATINETCGEVGNDRLVCSKVRTRVTGTLQVLI
jgi:hypothetical protein